MTEERGCENNNEGTWFSLNSVMLLFRAIPRRTQFSGKLEDCVDIKYMFNRFNRSWNFLQIATEKKQATNLWWWWSQWEIDEQELTRVAKASPTEPAADPSLIKRSGTILTCNNLMFAFLRLRTILSTADKWLAFRKPLGWPAKWEREDCWFLSKLSGQ